MPVKTRPMCLEELCLGRILHIFSNYVNGQFDVKDKKGNPRVKHSLDIVNVIFQPRLDKTERCPFEMLPGKVVELFDPLVSDDSDILNLMCLVHPQVRKITLQVEGEEGIPNSAARNFKHRLLPYITRHCKCLKELHIRGITATSKLISDTLTSLTHLTVLDLSHSSLRDEALPTLNSSCPNLTSLDITYCKFITDDGALFLCAEDKDHIQPFQALENLDVTKTKLSFGGVLSLLYYRNSLKVLQHERFIGKALVILTHQWPKLETTEGFSFLPRSSGSRDAVKINGNRSKVWMYTSTNVSASTSLLKSSDASNEKGAEISKSFSLQAFSWNVLSKAETKRKRIGSVTNYQDKTTKNYPNIKSLSIEATEEADKLMKLLKFYGKNLDTLSLKKLQNLSLRSLFEWCPNLKKLELIDVSVSSEKQNLTRCVSIKSLKIEGAFKKRSGILELLPACSDVELLILGQYKSGSSGSQCSAADVVLPALTHHGFKHLKTLKLVEFSQVGENLLDMILEDESCPQLSVFNFYSCGGMSAEQRKQAKLLIRNNCYDLEIRFD